MFLLCNCFSSLYSQDLDRKITVSFNDIPLSQVISEIGKRGNINFSYSSQQIPGNALIRYKARKKSISQILDDILSREGIGYKVLERQVVLIRKQVAAEVIAVKRGGLRTVSGFVRDKATGEALPGANIYEGGTFTGTTSNSYGFYSLSLAPGKHELICSFVGYRKETLELFLASDRKVYFDLKEILTEMKEVEIFPSGPAGISDFSDGNFRLSRGLISVMPSMGGEPDVIKSLQVVPGIQFFGDGSSLFYVRGGNSDQNLILIDDAPIYNPSHMFGFFSVLAPDAIMEAEVYKGDFPSNYGGRLSSVIDIKAKNGNLKHFGVAGNIGPYTSSVSLEGPVIKDKASFFLSGRVSTINWLKFLNTTSTKFDISFYDFNSKINYRINDNNRLFLTFYYGDDRFNRMTGNSINTYGISWDNMAGTFRWNHTFNGKLFSNTTVYYSRYNYFLYTSVEQNHFWTSSIANTAAKTDFTWYLNPSNTFRAGIEAAFHKTNPGNVNFSFSNDELKPEIPRYQSMEYTLYLGNDQKLFKNVNLRYGLRFPLWQDLGPTTVFFFDGNHKVIDTLKVKNLATYAWYFSPEPRLSISWSTGKNASFRANYSRNTQFMQVLSTSTSPFTSLEVWAPTGPNIQPRLCDQISLGYSGKPFQPVFQFSAEGYYKWYKNNIDYKDHANMLYNPLVEGELRTGRAWSYGLEFMIRKTEGRLRGWITYTYSRAFIKTPDVNGGEAYPAFYDRPHDLCLNLSYTMGDHLTFSGNWIGLSGAAITTPIGFYYYNGYSVPVYGKKNNDRLPVYSRLDLSMAYSFAKPGNRFQHSLLLTVYNVYGRNNPFSVNFNRVENDGEYIVPSDLYAGYKLVPTILSVGGIIPSLNYQFKF